MINIDHIISKTKNEEDIPLVKKAYALAEENLKHYYSYNNKSIWSDVLAVTNILLEFNADTSTIVGSLLYKLLDLGFCKSQIRKLFGPVIADISYGMWEYSDYSKNNLDDIMNNLDEGGRVMFIKLCKRLYELQGIKDGSSEAKRTMANNTLESYTTTGRKLHLAYISSKLEDLSLYYLEPEIYNEILSRIGISLDELREKLNVTKKEISQLLTDNDIEHQIKSRIKTIYSIYNKLSNGKKWEDIYDISAIRIVVDNEEDCEKVMDLIHSKYEYIPDRFKNYIDNPKENMYQSLHSTIFDKENSPLEIQVRTRDMDKTAESGSASHIEYKERQFVKNNFNKKISS